MRPTIMLMIWSMVASLRLDGIDVAPIAHHRHPVGDLLEFFQPVGDVDDAYSFVAQLADDAEKLINFRIRQSGGGSSMISTSS